MQILRSKIKPPAPPAGTIDRPRLLDRILDQDRSLVLLQAPAGYGKSVLAVQVHDEEPDRTAWLYLEPEDTDPRRFCRYVAGALAEVVPAIARTELFAASETPGFDPGAWVEDLALFLQELARTRLRLVLDNFEAVAGAPPVADILENLLRRGAGRLDLLITSRVPPGIRLARRTAGGGALVLGSGDLAFSLDEFKSAAAARGTDAAEAEIEARWVRSEGWCVVLALGTATGEGGDYLEEEVLSGIPAETARVLEKACLLDVIEDEALAALGHGDMATAELAGILTRHGVPHFQVGEESAIRLHPLVRDRLLDRFPAEDDLPAPDGPVSRVLAWYRSRGRHEDAIRLLIRLECYEDALRSITDDWTALEAADTHRQVESWLRLLPERFQTHPLYLAAKVRHLRFIGNNRELAAYVARVRETGALDDDNPLASQIWTSEVWAGTHLAEGPGYDVHRERWRSIEKRADAASRTQAHIALFVAAVYELRFQEALEHLDAADALTAGGSATQRGNITNGRGMLLHETGRSDEALASFEEGIALCRKQGEVSSLTMNLIGKANLCKDVGRFHDAIAAVDETLQTAREAGASRLVLLPHAARIRGEALWHLGRPEAALAELEEAYTYFHDHNRYEGLATGVLLDHWKRLSGKASHLVDDADFDAVGRRCEAHVRHLIRRGRERGERGEYEAAAAATGEARDLARDMPFWLAGAWLTEAWVRGQEGARAESAAALREGLKILDTLDRSVYGLADPDLNAWVAAEAAALDCRAERALAMVSGERAVDLVPAFEARLQRTEDPGEKERLVAAAARLGVRGLEETVAGLSRVPEATRREYARAVSAAALPPVRVRMLGPLSVTVLGREVRFPRRASRSVLEVLLLEHPRSVHEEQLIEFLWPDADPAKAKRSLQTAVNELRRCLDARHRPRQPSYVQNRDEGYFLELPPGSFVDAHAFRNGLERLQTSDREITGDARIRRLRDLLALYRGDLLADDVYAEHAGEPRERLRALMLEGLAALARALGPRGEDEIQAMLQKGLEVDPYWGEGVALLMDHFKSRGRLLAAIRVYRKYEQRLQDDLGLEPDPPLTRRFRALTASGPG